MGPASVATPKLVAYLALTGAGLLAAVAFQSPALAVMAVPFALVLAVGLAGRRPVVAQVGVEVGAERVVEGDELTVTVDVHLDGPADRVEVLLVAPPGFAVPADENPVAVGARRSRHRTVQVTGRPTRWGALAPVDVVVRTRDLFGLHVHESRHARPDRVRVYPPVEAVRRLVRPLDTQVLAGNQTARAKAEGVEFADLRPFVAGDRLRDVNWRVTARRGDLWVNQRHPDRNADVVLFLDAFDAAALDDAVRAASVLAHRYLQARDRVGLVSFGGTVRWLAAGAGTRQGYRLADALVESQVFENQADKSIDVLPGHVLPPSALVLALSPLVDERVVGALVELRRRGRDVAVIEVEPTRARSGATPGVEGDLAWRLWQLERRSVRDRLLEVGAAVVAWPEAPAGEVPTQGAVRERAALDAVGEGLAACRRRSQRVG